MRMNLYSVLDVQVKSFCPPFSAVNDAVAKRDFAYAANDLTTNVGRYPSDYKLYCIGSFDDEIGEVRNDVHRSLGYASAFVQRNEETENV